MLCSDQQSLGDRLFRLVSSGEKTLVTQMS